MTEEDKIEIFNFSNSMKAQLNGLPAMTMEEIDALNEDKEMIIKSTIMLIIKQERINYLEKLVAMTKITLDEKITAGEIIARIADTLKNVEVTQIKCNGDCNNCDVEH